MPTKPKKRIASLRPSVQTIDMRQGSTAVQRIRGHELIKIRERILLRDEYTCKRCGRVSRGLEVDHITPLHLGGAESDDNRQSLCPECHEKKTAEEEKGRGL